MSTATLLPPVSLRSMLDDYTPIKHGDEIVQADWCYSYDLYDAPPDPDMRVRAEWVGMKAKDAAFAWDYFRRPVLNFQI